MSRLRIPLLMFLAVTVTLLVSTGGGVTAAGPSKVPVIIGFDQPPGPAEAAQIRGLGGSISYTYRLIPAIAAELPADIIDALERSPHVAYVELDQLRQVHETELDNSWGVDRIDAEKVHPTNKGDGVSVGIIDTGIDCGHPDLDANCAGGFDFFNGDDEPDDDYGHGTHVAGTVAGEANGFGVVGVAPEADLYALKVCSSSGSCPVRHIVAALEWAASPPGDINDGNHLDVVNISLGGRSASISEELAVKAAYAAGVVIVASAGNSGNRGGGGDNVEYPAAFAEVIAVGATNKDDVRPSFSSTGPDVELAAPGVAVLSTVPTGSCALCRDSGYLSGSGTSMASPHVAGTAALVIAANPGWTNVQVRQQLANTADDLGAAGRDVRYGFGLVDAEEAAAPSGPDTTAPAVTSVDPLDSATGVDVSTNVVATFSESVDPATVDSTTFKLSVGGTDVASTVTLAGDGLSATFDPDADLANSTTYTVDVTNGVTDTSGNVLDPPFSSSFTTAAVDNTAPVISSVAASSITDTAADITWDTDEASDSVVNYGTTTALGFSASVADLVTSHLVGLSALTAETTYYYEVQSKDSSGNTATDNNGGSYYSFTTAAAQTTATTVSVDSITYDTTGGRNGDKHLLITVALLDDGGNPVADASVSIELYLVGNLYASGTGTTGTDGTVTFKAGNAPSGCYTETGAVSAQGLTWNGNWPDSEPADPFCK